MLESVLFFAGFALMAIGAVSLVYPLRWLGIRKRGTGVFVMAAAFLLIAIGAGMIDSYLVYFGLVLFAAGLLSLLRPQRSLYIRSRRAGLIVCGFGLVLSLGAVLVPYQEKKTITRLNLLDDWMPRWQVDERHTLKIAAPPADVFAAIREVRADEIFLFRTLTAIRRCGRTGPEDILNAPETMPILDVATKTTFVMLAEDAPRELVVGTIIAAPRELRGAGPFEAKLFREELPSGVVLATMNFLVTPAEGGGSLVTTETRVHANGPGALRRFTVYWRLIRPGSDIIRRMWLHAIARRAETGRLAAK